MNAVCVIPAKGTSKRIPGKNIREFDGRPIIEYTIAAALNAGCFDDVIVSTDSDQVTKIAADTGADVFHRSEETCGDFVPMVDAVVEVLQEYESDYVCMAYPCAPFIKPSRINVAYEMVRSGEYDSVFPVYRAEPPERTLIRRRDWFISRYPEYDNVNSDRFPYSYHIAGQFFFCDAEMVITHETVMLPRCWGIEIPRWEAVDIDTLNDWTYAELLWEVAQWS